MRDEWFTVDDRMVRLTHHVRPEVGKPYFHSTRYADVEKIAYGIGELTDRFGVFTLEQLAENEFGLSDSGRPRYTSRVAVVMAFARETGLIEKRGRDGHAARDDYDSSDLMLEFSGFNFREKRA